VSGFCVLLGRQRRTVRRLDVAVLLFGTHLRGADIEPVVTSEREVVLVEGAS
jgi:hypothetical protein